MRKLVTPTSILLLALATFAGSADAAFARGKNTILRNSGPIIIVGPAECEKKLVQKCRWEGNRKICEWVPSTECEMY